MSGDQQYEFGAAQDDDDDDDLYAVLNVPRTATSEEILAAYRKLSRLYHPDKHLDPEQKRAASDLFSRIKQAYDILIDEEKRQIYDVCGMQGLSLMNSAISIRHRTPREILAEFENIQRQKEEHALLSLTQPQFGFVMGLDYTSLFDDYLKLPYEERNDLPLLPEIRQWKATQAVRIGINANDSVKVNTQVFTKSGRGSGSVSMKWLHRFTHKRLENSHLETRATYEDGTMPVLASTFICNPWKNITLGIGGSVQYLSRVSAYLPGAHVTVGTRLTDKVSGQLNYNWNRMPQVSSRITWRHSDFLASSLLLHVSFSDLGASLYLEGNPLARWEHERQFGVAGQLSLGVNLQNGPSVEVGLTQKVTEYTSVGASLGVAMFTGVSLKLMISRGSQTLSVPIQLSEHVDQVAMFYGVAVPLLGYIAVRRLVYDPWKARQDAAKRKEDVARKMSQMRKRRREARQAQDLMRAAYARAKEDETRRHGLVILRAFYGYLGHRQVNGRTSLVTGEAPSDEDEEEEEEERVVDVTVPLQVQVENSRLELPPNGTSGVSRHQMQGFYDPCIGMIGDTDRRRQLYIRYLFHDVEHEVTVMDSEHLAIPMQKHRIAPGSVVMMEEP